MTCVLRIWRPRIGIGGKGRGLTRLVSAILRRMRSADANRPFVHVVDRFLLMELMFY
jgi:hypothetical protein